MRAAIALAVLLALLLPLRSFTAPRAPAVQPIAPMTTVSPVHLKIVSTKTPFTFSVAYLGNPIWQGNSEGESAAKEVQIPIPDEGVDLSVRVDWASAGTAAAKVILTHDHESSERTIWGDGRAAEVLTFP